jgi:hypothetical protein
MIRRKWFAGVLVLTRMRARQSMARWMRTRGAGGKHAEILRHLYKEI